MSKVRVTLEVETAWEDGDLVEAVNIVATEAALNFGGELASARVVAAEEIPNE